MPFHGILDSRRYLFTAEPLCDIGVNDAQAWRLNPTHRYAYNKLDLALAQKLVAAPCGVPPSSLGVAADADLFVKPIINLAGMSIGSQRCTAAALEQGTVGGAGYFWSAFWQGEHVSVDCLLKNGEVLWTACTLAASKRHQERPIYWQIGIDRPAVVAKVKAFLPKYLAGYTGLCNVELLGERLMEIHLRGSNGFLDFYGSDFIPAWIALVDHGLWKGLGPIPGGVLYSLFGEQELPANAEALAADLKVVLKRDRLMAADRAAILYAPDLATAERVAWVLGY